MGSPPTARIQPGHLVSDRYRIVRLLGEGGMGAVYEAEHTWTHRRVALKVLLPEYSNDEQTAARFMQEARAATRILHPNIVEVLDMGRMHDGTLFLVQEFLEGEDLAARLRREGVLVPSVALDLLVPILGALAAAHERGIVHRDVKPANIFLVTRKGEVVPKLIDFGISKMAHHDGHEQVVKTRTGAIIGTPAYMSPEQVRGELVDAATDVWAMGVVLYEALTGSGPFEGANYNMSIFRVLTETPPRADAVAAVPRELADVVERALQRDKDTRFPTMRAFLDTCLLVPLGETGAARTLSDRHHRSIEFRLPSLDPPSPSFDEWATVPAPRVDPPAAERHAVTTVKMEVPSNRRRAWVIVGILVAMVAVLTGVALAPGVRPEQPATPTAAPPSPVVAPVPIVSPPSPQPAAPSEVVEPVVADDKKGRSSSKAKKRGVEPSPVVAVPPAPGPVIAAPAPVAEPVKAPPGEHGLSDVDMDQPVPPRPKLPAASRKASSRPESNKPAISKGANDAPIFR